MTVEQLLQQNYQSHPKLRSFKSHPYLATDSTPPLPKPMHFHQHSDQTGRSSHSIAHKHQSSTVSLPKQPFAMRNNNNNIFEKSTEFEPFAQTAIYAQIDKRPHRTASNNQQVSIQPIYSSSGNIEQYETAFSYEDLISQKQSSNNQQIYINHPIRPRLTEPVLKRPLPNSTHTSESNGFMNNTLPQSIHFSDRIINNHPRRSNSESNAQIKKSHSNRDQTNHAQTNTYHGLPMKFVKALKKLFDMFDTHKCGLIRICDIENRIKDEEFDEELDKPQDLIDSLRKVTSPNGLINFSNFCAAINICLLKSQLAKSKQTHNSKVPPPLPPPINTRLFKNDAIMDRNDSYMRAQNIGKALDKNGFLSNGHLNGHTKQSSLNSNSPLENSSFTSTSSSGSSSRLQKDFSKLSIVKSNQSTNHLQQNVHPKFHRSNLNIKHRPSSVPVDAQYNNEDDTELYYNRNNCIQNDSMNPKLDNKAKSMGNLKEQIYANKLRLCSSEGRIEPDAVISPQAIMKKLFEWRNNLLERKLRMMNGSSHMQSTNEYQFSHPPIITQLQAPNVVQPQLNHLYSIVNKKTTINNRKRDETRRHTVTTLHSLNTAKKLLNMQKEKDLLQKGLLNLDRAKQFYIRQIEIVQNQIDHLNRYTQNGEDNFFLNQLNSDYNIQQHLDKLNSLEQMNRNLVTLLDSQFSQSSRLSGRLNDEFLRKFNNPFTNVSH